jgi:exopolyphosphatase / guanosine-5'-triphosphate,3'-diphosphate pyrophosphatase
MPKTNPPELVAAVDLGSNSFHCLIGRVVQSPLGYQIYPLDSLKETVRLAGGLGQDGRLDAASQARALAALQRFGERLRSFSPDHVRVVATNTLRIAKNSQDFLRTAEAALGFPIEVIAGQEEARLIFMGVAHSLPLDQRRRLVIDIGGGSTEFIIGTNYTPAMMESIYVGCVQLTRDFFPGGDITKQGFRAAVLAAREEIQVIRAAFQSVGWDDVVGSSGTAKAIEEVLALNGLSPSGITQAALLQLQALLIRVGRADQAHLAGLRQDRIPVFAGGVAIMLAIFEELEIDTMHYGEGALRLGVLYDLLGRTQEQDMRVISVEQAMGRYAVDTMHAKRVGQTAVSLLQGVAVGAKEEHAEIESQLLWASCLHEIGQSISHNSFHKHSAYIVLNADLPGFSKREQAAVAALVLGQRGKLTKVQPDIQNPTQWVALMCFRLACLLHRGRAAETLPAISLTLQGEGYTLSLPEQWLLAHPLTEFSLAQERQEWSKLGIDLQLRLGQEGAFLGRQSSAGA